MANIDNIPVVDLSSFTTSSNAAGQQNAAAQLREVLPLNGCVGISGHGVSSQLLAEAFAMTKKFFDLPYEDKMKAPHPEGPFPHRGYSGPGRERVAAKSEAETDSATKKEEYANTTDVKETFELGSEENKVQENIWLPEEVLPGFRMFMVKFYCELDKTANAVLNALIMSLELTHKEAATVKALHSVNETQMRLAHYLPIAGEGGIKDVSRLGAHTDWSTFTLLFQAEHGGLEFLDRATGDFIPATPIEGVLYMNIGDMFQRISNGLYPSALHRVIGKSASAARYSIPYFVSPAADGIVEPQPSVVAKAGKRVYEPVTQREYSEQQFQRINVRE